MEQRSGGARWQLWNLKAPEWRTAAVLGGLLVVGLILLSSRPAGAPAGAPAAGAGSVTAAGAAASDPLSAEEAAIDQNLAAVLGRVDGAGDVTVHVRLASGPTTVYATNDQDSDSTTSETTSGGGGQTTVQHSVTKQLAGGANGATPVVSVQAPAVSSVLVVATGAVSPVVQVRLAAAAQAATGVPLYQITVLPAGGGTVNGNAATGA